MTMSTLPSQSVLTIRIEEAGNDLKNLLEGLYTDEQSTYRGKI